MATRPLPISCSNMNVTPNRHLINETNSNKNYTLNIDKCLRKKLQAARRQKVEYAVKGGGIVANLDAVSFELFKHACSVYQNAFNDQIVRVDKDSATDNKGNVVQHTYTVHLKNNVGYTMNLYLTKCSLLINGKATMTFIDEHLPKIHEIMSHMTVSGISVDIQALNGLLAAQLQKVINDKNSLSLKTPKPTKLCITETDETENINCQKCSRNCRKRAVQCDSCKWWIHYHCAKLEESEINNIENNRTFSYSCAKCTSKTTPTRRLVIPAPYQAAVSPNTTPKTLSQSILSDEMNVECTICSTPFVDDEVACGKCSSLCHIFCMSPLNSEICLACAATDDSIQQNTPKPELNKKAENHSPNGQNTSPRNYSTHNQSVDISQTSIKTVIDTLPPSSQIEDLKKKESELSQKQRELRQLETKLKKREEDVKLKETKIKEYEKNSLKLETKLENLEFKNKELECTILTLKTRLNNIDNQGEHSEQTPTQYTSHQTSSSQNISRHSELIQGIHDRVLAYVLLKVEKQIEKLIDLDNDVSEQEYTSHTFNETETDDAHHEFSPPNTGNRPSVTFKDQVNKPVYPENRLINQSVTTMPEAYNQRQCRKPEKWDSYSNDTYQQPTNDGTVEYNNGQPLFYQADPNVVRKEKRFLRKRNLINLVN